MSVLCIYDEGFGDRGDEGKGADAVDKKTRDEKCESGRGSGAATCVGDERMFTSESYPTRKRYKFACACAGDGFPCLRTCRLFIMWTWGLIPQCMRKGACNRAVSGIMHTILHSHILNY